MRYSLRRDLRSGEFQGVDFLEQELLEISAAPVPANAQALKKALADKPIMSAFFSHSYLARYAAAIPPDVSIDDLLAVLRGAAG